MKSLNKNQLSSSLQFIYTKLLKDEYRALSEPYHGRNYERYAILLYTRAGDKDQYWFLLDPNDIPRIM